MAEVSIRSVRKSFGPVEVLHGIDLEIADGEFVAVVGPSGCGKSTLLRLVAGLEEITAGEIAIAGRVVNDVEPKDRDIAMVFQNYALYPHMSVFENMAFGLRLRGLSKAAVADRVAAAARILQLEWFLQRKPRHLSGGQRQRVAMGRAIVREPAVFLFDEPLSNLDAKLRVQMRLEIRQLHQTLGATSIYVTHDQVEAMTMADRLVVMNAGVIEQIGSPIEIYEKPATVYVAEFIGSPAMNILRGAVSDDGRAVCVDGTLTLPLRAAAAPGRPILVGIRPEHIDPGPSDAADRMLTVGAVEPLGADTIVHGRLPGGAQTLSARLRGNHRLRCGDELPVAIDARHLHLFDPADGRRLAEARADRRLAERPRALQPVA